MPTIRDIPTQPHAARKLFMYPAEFTPKVAHEMSQQDRQPRCAVAAGSPLLAWLHKAVQEVESSTDKLGAFLRLRYDEMGRLFPHDVFSVQEATPDFFAETIRYLTTGIPENRPGIKPEDAKHDIYWRRYRDWMKANTP